MDKDPNNPLFNSLQHIGAKKDRLSKLKNTDPDRFKSIKSKVSSNSKVLDQVASYKYKSVLKTEMKTK